MRIQKSVFALTTALLCLSLAACSERPAPVAAVEATRPAPILTVGRRTADEALRLPGRVRAARRAELSFDVPGFVDSFSLEEGRRVKAGEVVARLDDRIYRSRLDAARAEFERARNDLARYQRLWESEQAVARAEVDDRRARLEAARTSLAAAERDLADTAIKAPFEGVITRRRIEPFTNVQAKQPIAELQDLRALEVVVNVPERLVRRMRPQQAAVAFLEGERSVEGDRAAPGQVLRLELQSFAAEADALDAPPGAPVVAFCNTGHWSATDWFVLSEVLGRPGVRMYPGSMVEWTQSPAPLPMANEPGRWRQLRYMALGWAHRNLGTKAP